MEVSGEDAAHVYTALFCVVRKLGEDGKSIHLGDLKNIDPPEDMKIQFLIEWGEGGSSLDIKIAEGNEIEGGMDESSDTV